MFHDAERFSDRENLLIDYHPAFQTPSPDEDDEPEPADADGEMTSIASAVEDTIALFSLLGWPAATERAGVEYICTRLAESSSRTSAFEGLRRDFHARVLLGIHGSSWLVLLRTVLGNSDPDLARTNAGRGVLLRLLIGEPLRVLLSDDALLAEVVLSAPGHLGRRRD